MHLLDLLPVPDNQPSFAPTSLVIKASFSTVPIHGDHKHRSDVDDTDNRLGVESKPHPPAS